MLQSRHDIHSRARIFKIGGKIRNLWVSYVKNCGNGRCQFEYLTQKHKSINFTSNHGMYTVNIVAEQGS